MIESSTEYQTTTVKTKQSKFAHYQKINPVRQVKWFLKNALVWIQNYINDRKWDVFTRRLGQSGPKWSCADKQQKWSHCLAVLPTRHGQT